jgi:hypothetical protein
VEELERPRLLLRTARSLWMAGTPGTERTVEARGALVAAGDREGTAEAELLLADTHWYEGRRRRVADDMERALGFVRGQPASPVGASVLEHAARFHMLADESEAAIDLGRQALAKSAELGLDGLRAHCLSDIGVARVRSGDLAGLDDLRTASEVALAAHDGWAAWRARANLADCLLWQVGDAEQAFAERHELKRILSSAGSWPVARWNQAYDAAESYWCGRWTETLEPCDEFIRRVEAGNPHTIASELYALRALLAAARGDGHALEDARVAVRLGRCAGDTRNLFPALAVNAWIASGRGQGEEADRLVDELLCSDLPEPFPNYVVPLALAALELGRTDAVAARLAAIAPSPWRDAAEALLRDHVDAADRFVTIGVLPEEATARLLAAEAAANANEVRAQLALCVPFFERVGATAYLARAEELR